MNTYPKSIRAVLGIAMILLAILACNGNGEGSPEAVQCPYEDPAGECEEWSDQSCQASVAVIQDEVSMDIGNQVHELTVNHEYIVIEGTQLSLRGEGQADVDYGDGHKMTFYAPREGETVIDLESWNGTRSVVISAGAGHIVEDDEESGCRTTILAATDDGVIEITARGTEFFVSVSPGAPENQVQVAVGAGEVDVIDVQGSVVTLSPDLFQAVAAVMVNNGQAGEPMRLDLDSAQVIQNLSLGRDILGQPISIFDSSTNGTPVVTETDTVDAPVKTEVILALYEDPENLNPFLESPFSSGEVSSPIIEGLLGVSSAGEYYPVLAEEVPTLENGGVLVDGEVLTVIYNLKQGILWSTGVPFTCDDIVFTWEALIHPQSGAILSSVYSNITSVECADDYTAVITFEPFYYAYLQAFDAVMPRHAAGDPADMQNWDYNWDPVGTGPYKLDEWVTGEYITLVKNENYRQFPGKPYLEKLVFRFIPSREAGIAMIQTGEIDLLWNLAVDNIPDLDGVPGVELNIAPSPGTERLVLNLADPILDATDDPLNNPHPLLGDLRVRQAIQASINKQEIINRLLYGKTTIGTRESSVGWGSGCDIPESIYDPDAARALLDEAGFIDENGDGVRECKGCLYAKYGTPLRLKLQSTSGNQLRAQTEELLLAYWAKVGIEGFIENVPPLEFFFDTWANGSFIKHGQFDILMYTILYGPDPHYDIENFFHTDRMPQESNNGTGDNYSRWVNPADWALEAASISPDIAERSSLYCEVQLAIAEELPHIYLYNRMQIHATRKGLINFEVNVWTNQTWNTEDWYWAGQ